MSHDWIADINFFRVLDDEDARVTAEVRSAGCPDCGGRLDQANYPRKPRGGDLGAAGEIFDRRRSLCCAREGCRHRRTPPSLMFLGRRVYLAITVVVAAWRAVRPTSPPQKTIGRWRSWFAALQATNWWTVQRGRLWPPIEPAEILPAAIIERVLVRRPVTEALVTVLGIVTSWSTIE